MTRSARRTTPPTATVTAATTTTTTGECPLLAGSSSRSRKGGLGGLGGGGTAAAVPTTTVPAAAAAAAVPHRHRTVVRRMAIVAVFAASVAASVGDQVYRLLNAVNETKRQQRQQQMVPLTHRHQRGGATNATHSTSTTTTTTSFFGNGWPGRTWGLLDPSSADDDNDDNDAVNDNNDTFSACLLWMDDNFRLPEWLAYHYYMINLRHVVLLPDPRSRTDPWDVLKRWKSLMTIEVWSNDNLNLTMNAARDTIKGRTTQHRARQSAFVQQCAVHLQQLNRSWTTFHDVDEYLVVAPPQANVSRHDISTTPGIVLQLLKRYGSGIDDNHHRIPNDDHKQYYSWVDWFSSRPCMTIPRVLFSAASSSMSDVTRDVPIELADLAPQLDTLNYRFRATPRGKTDGAAKAIVDVSRLPSNAVQYSGGSSAHRPFKNDTICTHVFPTTEVLPLVIHHYLGSWEAFSFRDDARKGGLRTIEKWQERSTLTAGGVNDDARPWLSGFVALVGIDKARELLNGSGLPQNYRKSHNETNEWAARLIRRPRTNKTTNHSSSLSASR